MTWRFYAPAILSSGGPTASYTYNATYQDTSNLTTYTFTSSSVGTAAADRLVVVLIHARGGSDQAINNVTIGGGGATLHLNASSGFNNFGMASYALTTGTTATISVNFVGSRSRCQIGVYSLYGLGSSTPSDTVSGSTASSISIDVVDGGILLAGCSVSSTVATKTVTYSGTDTLGEDYDQTLETFVQCVGDSCLLTQTATARTISWASSSTGLGGAAVWS